MLQWNSMSLGQGKVWNRNDWILPVWTEALKLTSYSSLTLPTERSFETHAAMQSAQVHLRSLSCWLCSLSFIFICSSSPLSLSSLTHLISSFSTHICLGTVSLHLISTFAPTTGKHSQRERWRVDTKFVSFKWNGEMWMTSEPMMSQRWGRRAWRRRRASDGKVMEKSH